LGGELARGGYQGQVAALDPYAAYLKSAAGLETLGQQPLDIGSALGGRNANAAGAQALLTGNMPSQQSFQANAYNPFATALTGLSQNQQFTSGLAKQFGPTTYNNPFAYKAPSFFDGAMSGDVGF
jgi:hypothetical protein